MPAPSGSTVSCSAYFGSFAAPEPSCSTLGAASAPTTWIDGPVVAGPVVANCVVGAGPVAGCVWAVGWFGSGIAQPIRLYSQGTNTCQPTTTAMARAIPMI